MVWTESILEVFGEKLLRERRDKELLDYARDSVTQNNQPRDSEDNYAVRMSVYSDVNSRDSVSLISQMLKIHDKNTANKKSRGLDNYIPIRPNPEANFME